MGNIATRTPAQEEKFDTVQQESHRRPRDCRQTAFTANPTMSTAGIVRHNRTSQATPYMSSRPPYGRHDLRRHEKLQPISRDDSISLVIGSFHRHQHWTLVLQKRISLSTAHDRQRQRCPRASETSNSYEQRCSDAKYGRRSMPIRSRSTSL